MAIFSWLTQKLNGVESVVDSSKIKFSSNMSETESVYDKISDLNSDRMMNTEIHFAVSLNNGFVTIQFEKTYSSNPAVFLSMEGASTTTPIILKVADVTTSNCKVAALSTSGGYLPSVLIRALVVPTS